MKLQFIRAGLQTAIRDFGNPAGQRHLALPTFGVMDPLSAAAANTQIGRPWNAALIECTRLGPDMVYSGADVPFSLYGADMMARLNTDPRPPNYKGMLRDGDRLQLGAARSGARSYIAVGAKFSQNQYDHILWDGVEINLDGPVSRAADHSVRLPKIGKDIVLRFCEGPDFQCLTPEAQNGLLSSGFSVSPESNRMGVRLAGNDLRTVQKTSLSSFGVFPGAIQLPPGGRPIILGPDCGVTGGYPLIGQIIKADRPIIGQLTPGQNIYLKRINAPEARDILKSRQSLISLKIPGFRFHL